jgi:glycine/D-amino acid oxidase-like deaminating enzyme
MLDSIHIPGGGDDAEAPNRCDVLVIGGAAMGTSTALALRRADSALHVIIVEPDSTYAEAATLQASGGVRQLFTQPENIQLSQYTLEVLHNLPTVFGAPDRDLYVGWQENGYLFLARTHEVDLMREHFEHWREHGVNVQWLTPADLQQRYPILFCDDLGGGVLSPDDGWLDPASFLRLIRTVAIDEGTRYVADRVIEIQLLPGPASVRLASGRSITAEVVVNAAGCWAPSLSRAVGMPVPVEPMRRYHHYVEGIQPFEGLPFIKDASGLAIQALAPGLLVGLVDFSAPGGFDTPIDAHYFDSFVWQPLAHRIPLLERCRLGRTGTNFYDQNRLDGNAILGNWPGKFDNYYIACGFSGHGLMHALGMGRALAELILRGAYQTIDLGRFGYQRVLETAGVPERGVR